jgi:hypothetical protein
MSGVNIGANAGTISAGTVGEIVGKFSGESTGRIASKFFGKSVAIWFGGIFSGFASIDRLQDRGHGSDRQTAG